MNSNTKTFSLNEDIEVEKTTQIRDQTLGKDGDSLPKSEKIIGKEHKFESDGPYTFISDYDAFSFKFMLMVTTVGIIMSVSGSCFYANKDVFSFNLRHLKDFNMTGKQYKKLVRALDRQADKYRKLAQRHIAIKRKMGVMKSEQYNLLIDEILQRFKELNEKVASEVNQTNEFTEQELLQTFSIKSTEDMLKGKHFKKDMIKRLQDGKKEIGKLNSGSKKGDGPDQSMSFECAPNDSTLVEIDIFMYHIHYYKQVKAADTLDYWTKLRISDVIQEKRQETRLLDRHASQQVILEGNSKKEIKKPSFKKDIKKVPKEIDTTRKEEILERMRQRAKALVEKRFLTPISLARTIRHDLIISRKWAEALAKSVIDKIKAAPDVDYNKETIALLGYCETITNVKVAPKIVDVEFAGLFDLAKVKMIDEENINNIVDDQQREQVRRMLNRRHHIPQELIFNLEEEVQLREPEVLVEFRPESWEDGDLIRQTEKITVRIETADEIKDRLARGNIELNPGPITEIKLIMDKIKAYTVPQAKTQLTLSREEICRTSFIEEDIGHIAVNNGSTIISSNTSPCGSQWTPMGVAANLVSPQEAFVVIGIEFRQKNATIALNLTNTGAQMKLRNDTSSTIALTQVMRTNNEYFNGFSVASVSLLLNRLQEYMDQSVIRTSYTRVWLGFYKIIHCKFFIGSGLTVHRNELWTERAAAVMNRASEPWTANDGVNNVGIPAFLITTKTLSDWLMGREAIIDGAGPLNVEAVGQDQGIAIIMLDEILLMNPKLLMLVIMCHVRSKLLDNNIYGLEVGNNSDVENYNLYGDVAAAPTILRQNVHAERIYLQGPSKVFIVLPPGQEGIAQITLSGIPIPLHVNPAPGVDIVIGTAVTFNTLTFQDIRLLETYMNKWYNDPVGKKLAFRLMSNYSNRYLPPSSVEIGSGPRVYPATTAVVPQISTNLTPIEAQFLYRANPKPLREAIWEIQVSMSALKELNQLLLIGGLNTTNSAQFASTFVSGNNYYIDMLRHLDIVTLGNKIDDYADVNLCYYSREFAGLLATLGDFFFDEASVPLSQMFAIEGGDERITGYVNNTWLSRKKMSVRTLHMFAMPGLDFEFNVLRNANLVPIVINAFTEEVIPVFESVNFYTSRIEDKLNESALYTIDVPLTPVANLVGGQARMISEEKILQKDDIRYLFMRELAGALTFGWLNEQSVAEVPYEFFVLDERLVANGSMMALKLPVINDNGGRKEFAYKLTWNNRIFNNSGDVDRITNFNFLCRQTINLGSTRRLATRNAPRFTYGKVKLGGSVFKNSNWHKGFTMDTTLIGANEITLPDVDFDLNSSLSQPKAAEDKKQE